MRAGPVVLLGDSFASSRYWHGAVMQRWADDWTALYTEGRGRVAMTNMEDHVFAHAIERLALVGRADFQRLLVLRTGSNYSMPPKGVPAADSMVAEYQGMLPALEAAHHTGSTVVKALLADWTAHASTPPTAK